MAYVEVENHTFQGLKLIKVVVGSNPTLSYVILGPRSCFMYLKTQKGIFICHKLMPKAKKFKKQKINSEPLWTTVLASVMTYVSI